MGRDLPTPLEEVMDRDVQDFPKPPDWDDAEWSSLRERARHLLAKPIRPTQDLLDAIEPELLENNYTLQAFTWVPPGLETTKPTDTPTNEMMADFHADESRAPLGRRYGLSIFRLGKCDGEVGLSWSSSILLVLDHGAYVVRFSPKRMAVMFGHRACQSTALSTAVVSRCNIKRWSGTLESKCGVTGWQICVVSWIASTVFRDQSSCAMGALRFNWFNWKSSGDEISIEVVEFQSESTFFHIDDDWSPVPLQLVWRRLARGLSVLLEEGASKD